MADTLLALSDAAVDPYLSSLSEKSRIVLILLLESEKQSQYRRLLRILASSYATCEQTVLLCIELVHFHRISRDCSELIMEQLKVTIGQLAAVKGTNDCVNPLRSVLALLVQLLYVPCSGSSSCSSALSACLSASSSASVFDFFPMLFAAFNDTSQVVSDAWSHILDERDWAHVAAMLRVLPQLLRDPDHQSTHLPKLIIKLSHLAKTKLHPMDYVMMGHTISLLLPMSSQEFYSLLLLVLITCPPAQISAVYSCVRDNLISQKPSFQQSLECYNIVAANPQVALPHVIALTVIALADRKSVV